MQLAQHGTGNGLLPRSGGEYTKGSESQMERPLKKFAVVGMGILGKRHSNAQIQNPKAELVAAIINRPPVLILDELTADLDEDSIWDIMQLLNEINRLGSTIVMATHAKKFVNILRKRVITLLDGRIWGDVLQGRYGDIS